MRTLTVFNSVSLDGYFTDAKSDMSFAHGSDPEFDEFTVSNTTGDGVLLFGRVTYELMASFWPTPAAKEQMPDVAKGMNRMPKFVFSRTLTKASVTWENTTLLTGDLVEETRKLKQSAPADLIILGSGKVVSQLSQARLVDRYQLVVVPIALGAGRTMFEGMRDRLELKLVESRAFKNIGNVVNTYEVAR